MGNLSHLNLQPPAPRDPADQLKDAIAGAGLTPPEAIHLDGKLHRFASGTKGQKGHDKPGWYIAFADGVPAGRFGDWRTGHDQTWVADIGRQLSPAEQMANARRMAEARALRDAEIARARQMAAETVERIWSDGGVASPDHPYLARKRIATHGARVTGDGRLMVPLYDEDGSLSSLQYIDADGGKLFHPGGASGGRFWWLGDLNADGPIYIAEGFATAATIHETTHRPVVIAYSSHNIPRVAAIMRDRFGVAADLAVVADNDHSGTGANCAAKAAQESGTRTIMPPYPGMDANDYALAGHDLAALIAPPPPSAVVEKLQVMFGDELGETPHVPDELIEGMLTIGGTAVLYGDSNSGKTFFALSLATAIAEGVECYGRQVDPGLVVYLATEAPGSIKTRMQAIRKHLGANLHRLAMVPVPLNFYSGDADAHDVVELVRAISEAKGEPVRLIIADTLARMSSGANENSGEDMGPVMERFVQVSRATGAAMLLIHHNGKDAAKGARGWSGIRAVLDTEIEVVEKDGVRSATFTKQRELPGKGDSIFFKLDIVEMGETKFGKPATTCVAIPDDTATMAGGKPAAKSDGDARTVESAWREYGMEIRNGSPYLSRSALRDYLVAKLGMAERTAKNKTEEGRPDGMIGRLLAGGILAPHEHGWLFTDDVQTSAMMLLRGGTQRDHP